MISKIKTYIYSFICCSSLLISCTYDNDLREENEELVINCNKSISWSNSRITMDDNGSGNFTNGDRIDLMVISGTDKRSMQPEFSAGQWTPSLKRSDFSSDELKLSALFPVLPSDGYSDRTISIPVDQTTQDNQVTTDVLYANSVAGYSDSSVSLQFEHALHRVCINLKGYVPDDLQMEIYSITEGNISVENGKVSLSGDNVRKWIKPFKENQYTYTAIILPQDATPYHSGDGFIRLTTGGKIVSYSLDKSISSFDQGMQTTINLKLKSSETGDVDPEFSNQIRWVYGVKAPNFPGKENIRTYEVGEYDVEEGIWLRYAYENMYPPQPIETQYLTWKEGCGWYDCNKSFEYKGDRNMCWAAGASNLIHWWIEHNRKFIDAYDEKYKLEPDYIKCPDKYSKMTEENQHHSEVFNFFKSSFRDKGSWDTGGVNWFINGDRKNISPDILNFKGFFSHVFTKDDKVKICRKKTLISQ